MPYEKSSQLSQSRWIPSEYCVSYTDILFVLFLIKKLINSNIVTSFHLLNYYASDLEQNTVDSSFSYGSF